MQGNWCVFGVSDTGTGESGGCSSAAMVSVPEQLPRLERVDGEVHIWVDSSEGEGALDSVAEEAFSSHASQLLVAVDVEWHDPRPVSLVQLAVSTDLQKPPTVFLVDMVHSPRDETIGWCRRLLSPESHQVLAFSCREDKRRLQQAGLLSSSQELDWLDLQHRFDRKKGSTPSLQSVVASALGLWMDKRLQTSDWDARPLTEDQREYAALDASVLLRLYGCKPAALTSFKPTKAPVQVQPDLSEEALKEHWNQYRAQPFRKRTRVFHGGARERNDDLSFLLPSTLTRLMRKMRGLGLDTEIMREGTSQQALVEAAEKDDKIILFYKAKKLLPGRVAHRTYILQSSVPDDQTREVIDAFDVVVDSDCLCGRCVQCNAWDWHLVGRDAVRGNPQVAPKTLDNFEEFWICGGCNKIYWEGKMHEKALGHFRSFMPEGA